MVFLINFTLGNKIQHFARTSEMFFYNNIEKFKVIM